MLKLMTLTSLIFASGSLLAERPIIIGSDNRVQVINLKTDPFVASVGFLLKASTGGFCTGTLITSRHVITNGHCVIPSMKFPSKLLAASDLTFNPGKLGYADGPLGPLKVKSIKTFANWVQKGDADFDVAVIELAAPVNIPHIRMVSYSNVSAVEHKPITITGYAGGLDSGTMWTGTGRIRTTFNNGMSFIHDVDTVSGTSGSVARMKVGNEWVGVGVHRGDYLGGNEEMNRGVLFSPAIMAAINRWIKQ